MFSYVILSQAHAIATKPWHMFSSYELHMIVSLALVAATCSCKLFHRVILGDFVPSTRLCYNTLLHVLLACIACDVVADTCRRNKSPHQNPSCLTTLNDMHMLCYKKTVSSQDALYIVTVVCAWSELGVVCSYSLVASRLENQCQDIKLKIVLISAKSKVLLLQIL